MPSRKLKPLTALRPITSRALTSLKDTLHTYWQNARVLDLFSGSGRLAWLAFAEGAAEVEMVEADRARVRILHSIAKTKNAHAHVHQGDALLWLESAAHHKRPPYDIIFCDPPFRWWTDEKGDRLVRSALVCLVPAGVLVVRLDKKDMLPSGLAHARLQLWKNSVFGESRLLYMKMLPESSLSPEQPHAT